MMMVTTTMKVVVDLAAFLVSFLVCQLQGVGIKSGAWSGIWAVGPRVVGNRTSLLSRQCVRSWDCAGEGLCCILPMDLGLMISPKLGRKSHTKTHKEASKRETKHFSGRVSELSSKTTPVLPYTYPYRTL